MTLRLSTGLRNAMVGTVGFAGALNDGVIEIRTGTQPATANDPATGTLLGLITVDAGAFTPGSATNGLGFDAAASGAVSKAAAENWKFVGIANGTAGWFRFRGNAADDNSTSTTLRRLDGSVGTSGADATIGNAVVATGAPNTMDVFTFTLPTL